MSGLRTFFTLSPKLAVLSPDRRYIIDLDPVIWASSSFFTRRSAREFAPPNCPTEISSNVATSHWVGGSPTDRTAAAVAVRLRSAAICEPRQLRGPDGRRGGRAVFETPVSQVGLGEQVQWEGLAGAQILAAARVSARLITDVWRRRFRRCSVPF